MPQAASLGSWKGRGQAGSWLAVVPVETACGCAYGMDPGQPDPTSKVHFVGSVERSMMMKMPESPGAKSTFKPRQQQLLHRINLLMLLKYVHRAAAGFCLVLVCF